MSQHQRVSSVCEEANEFSASGSTVVAADTLHKKIWVAQCMTSSSSTSDGSIAEKSKLKHWLFAATSVDYLWRDTRLKIDILASLWTGRTETPGTKMAILLSPCPHQWRRPKWTECIRPFPKGWPPPWLPFSSFSCLVASGKGPTCLGPILAFYFFFVLLFSCDAW